jgi:hypothetical protein
MSIQNLNPGWGGVPVSPAAAIAGDGTQVGPSVRPIQRKYTYLLRTNLPLANEVWASPWIDTEQTGGHHVFVVVGNTATTWNTVQNAIQIQGTNDPSNTATQTNLVVSGFDNILNAYKIQATITTRYWRVQFTAANTTYTGQFELTATEMTVPPSTTVSPYGGTIVNGLYGTADNQVNSNFGPLQLSALTTAGTPFTALMGVADYAYNGSNWSAPRVVSVFKNIAAVAVTSGTPVLVWTPTSGKKFRLMGFMVSSSVAGSVIFKDTTATEILRTPLMAAGVGQSSPTMGNGILSGTANNGLYIDVTATGSVSGFVFGTEE